MTPSFKKQFVPKTNIWVEIPIELHQILPLRYSKFSILKRENICLSFLDYTISHIYWLYEYTYPYSMVHMVESCSLSGDWTQVIRTDGKHLCLLSQFASFRLPFFSIFDTTNIWVECRRETQSTHWLIIGKYSNVTKGRERTLWQAILRQVWNCYATFFDAMTSVFSFNHLFTENVLQGCNAS